MKAKMTQEELRAKAKADDAEDRATDFGVGRPNGPSGSRRPRTRPRAQAELMRRLRTHAPHLYQLVMQGVITTNCAAVTAGFYRGRRNQHKPPSVSVEGSSATSHAQEMEIWFGVMKGKTSAFANDDERKRIYFEQRDKWLRFWANNGRRPMAYWRYESPIPYPGFDRERSTLYTAGLLGAEEVRELEEYWHTEFERSVTQPWDDHIDHLIFCDVPAELADRWAAENVPLETA